MLIVWSNNIHGTNQDKKNTMKAPSSIITTTSATALLTVAVPTVLAVALYHHVNWPRTIFRFVFGILAPVKETLWPSDSNATDISPQSRGLAWILLTGPPPPHNVETIRNMMKHFWPHVWPIPDPNIVQVTKASISGTESLLILPKHSTRPKAALLHLHGGGMIAGTTGTEQGLAVELAKRLQVPVLSVDYRLVPEHSVEDAVDDVVAAYQWMVSQEHFQDRKISFMGGSAGAGLALLAALKIRDSSSLKMPKSLVLASPAPGMEFLPTTTSTDHQTDQPWESMTYNAPKDGYMAGNFYQYVTSVVYTEENKAYYQKALANLNGLPPCLVTSGEYEVILGGIQRLATTLQQANVKVHYREYPKMQHVHFAFFEFTPEALAGLDDIVHWLNESWKE